MTAICVPNGFNSDDVVKTAYHRYRMSLGVGLSKVAGRVFRIGHIGNINEIMILQALAGCEMALRDVGVPVAAGSGVAAAQEHFRATAPQAGTEQGRLISTEAAVKICIYGAGAIGGYLAAGLERGRRRRAVAGRARPASGGDPGQAA